MKPYKIRFSKIRDTEHPDCLTDEKKLEVEMKPNRQTPMQRPPKTTKHISGQHISQLVYGFLAGFRRQQLQHFI